MIRNIEAQPARAFVARPIGRDGAIAQSLSNGRLHLQHGPIDLIVQAWGSPQAVRSAYTNAEHCFSGILFALTAELTALRDASSATTDVKNIVAKRMIGAVEPFRAKFITPMAAVAGAVADEVLGSVITSDNCIERAYVNNGGDIAVFNESAEPLTIGVMDGIRDHRDSRISVRRNDGVGGIATSGWRGRSFSLGIADAVTVITDCAATADAAATLIANAVNTDAPGIERQPASSISPDTDLADRPVTISVGRLNDTDRSRALGNGEDLAQRFVDEGRIIAAYIALQNECRIVRYNEHQPRTIHN